MNVNFDTCTMSRTDALGVVALMTSLFDLSTSNGQADPAPSSPALQLVPSNPPAQAVTEVNASAPDAGAATQASSEPQTTRKRRTKAEIAADEAAAKQAAVDPTAAGAEQPASAESAKTTDASPSASASATEAKPLTADELRTLLNGYIARHSMEEAIKQLQAFNCNRVSEALTLEPAKLAELAAVLRG